MEVQDRKPRKKPTKIDEMTKEQIRQAIIKKRECNAKAQQIVESLLEKGTSETYFMQCLPDINQSHLEDIIEERAIAHLCGYPICSETISERDIPKQKYRISTKTNKVYDITARKNFCSNSCYKSAMHVKKQMLTSPLWFREYEDMPEFKLLPLDSPGSLGQEVDLILIKPVTLNPQKNTFTSINDFTSASLNEITGTTDNDTNENIANEECDNTKHEELNKNETNVIPNICNDKINNEIENGSNTTHIQDIEIKDNLDVPKSDTQLNNEFSNSVKHHIENNDKESESTTSISHSNTNTLTNNEPEKKSISNPLNIVGEIVEKPEKKIDPIIANQPDNTISKQQNPQKVQKKQPSVTVLTIEVEQCLAEWFTLDTLLFIFGEEKVKEMVADKGECIKEYLNNYAKSIFYSSNTYDQYQALCRKLNMLEMEDRRNDAQAMQRESKPLPDYSILQEESKNMQLKVKAFFAGETDMPNTNTSDVKETEEGTVTQLPLVDSNAQNALRRRIVCQHLNKVLPDLLQSLGLLTLSISSDVRLIVNTFKLKANNVMFKPIQWTLIAIIIVKLLSLRDRRLEYMMESPTAYQNMQLLLLSFKQDGGYLERLISWLTDIDRLLNTNDTQLTIG